MAISFMVTSAKRGLMTRRKAKWGAYGKEKIRREKKTKKSSPFSLPVFLRAPATAHYRFERATRDGFLVWVPEYRWRKTKETKDRKQNNSKQHLTTKKSKAIQIQCFPLLAEGPSRRGSNVTIRQLSFSTASVPDQCSPRGTTVQAVLVEHYRVSSECRLKCFFFACFLSFRVTVCHSRKQSHETQKLLHCLQVIQTKDPINLMPLIWRCVDDFMTQVCSCFDKGCPKKA